MRECETMCKECILAVIRDNMPVEHILRSYMDESVEQDEEVFVETMKEPEIVKDDDTDTNTKDVKAKEELVEKEVVPITPAIQNIDEEEIVTKLTFNDLDSAISVDKKEEVIEAPKTLERLEDISISRALKRQMENDADDEDDERIKIHTGDMDLSGFEVLDEPKSVKLDTSEIFLDAEQI